MDLHERCTVVFTAQSKYYFFCRDAVCEFVLNQGCVPLNPFQAFGYFLSDRVDRDLIRRGNFNFLSLSDELWVFGEKIANGVVAEIIFALEHHKPIRFFSISATVDEIAEIPTSALTLEPGEEYDAHQRELLAALFSSEGRAAYGHSRD